MRCFLVLSLVLSLCAAADRAQAQNSSNQDSATQDPAKQTERKVVKQTMPRYPDLARRLSLAGTVKVMAVVMPDGKVKKVEPVGGSPLLVQAAEEAIFQWKFAPASAESREVIELHFNPPQ
jgi:TonB family protein